MQYVGHLHNVEFLPAASNDNEDLLSLNFPSFDLALIRKIKLSLREENIESGILLSSRKERRFFQEIVDAERYIVMRYFTPNVCEKAVRALKRHIMNSYLMPRKSPRKKK